MPRFAPCALSCLLLACGGGAAAEPDSDDEAATAGDETAAPFEFGVQVEEGRLWAGGQPTDMDLRAAADAGVEHVITLRPVAEPGQDDEQATVEGLGMRFTRIPVAGADGITAENARALDAALGPEPTLLHCASGNRTGALLGLRAYLNGDVDEMGAVSLAERSGMTNLEGALRQAIAAAQPAE